MPTPDSAAARLLRFNHDVLAQALALAAAHEAPGAPAYTRPVGAHLRHVVEHYEALLQPAQAGVVDYDRRPRDSALEQSPRVAQQRLHALQALLAAGVPVLDTPLQVRGQAGLAGEFDFELTTTLGRELVFVAGHAVHHFAVLKAHCQEHGLAVAGTFGQAPATVAHERAQLACGTAPARNPTVFTKETSPCNTQPATA
jgi:hypothetical protein